ncbi:hypothetical protein [Streptomyces sp. DW26H14]|uniref:hypothetical protein n=1 Tax=Streptomyces sp. DW26H14 TaxID=3435395 RepID=UPI00403D5D35
MGDNNSFSVDTEGLSHVIPDVENLASRIRSIGTQLQGKLDSLGECWGNDKNGEQFLSQYTKPKGQLIEGISSSGEVLDSTVEGIYTMAKQYDRLEQENMLALQKLKAVDPDVDISGSGSGGSGGDSDGDGTENLQPTKRMAAERTRAEDAEQPRLLERGTMKRRLRRGEEVPAEPLQPVESRERGRLTKRVAETPATEVEPRLLERGVPAIPAERLSDETPGEPLQPMLREGVTSTTPAEPGQPRMFERSVRPTELRRGEEVPAQPLQPVESVRRRRLADGESEVPESPTQPRLLSRSIPAIPATPAIPAVPASEVTPAEPLQPMQPLQPMEPLQPTEPFQPTEPLQPMERGQLPVETNAVPDQPRHFERGDVTVPEQPRHFSRLEPEVPAQPVTPAHHLTPEQPVTSEQPRHFSRGDAMVPERSVSPEQPRHFSRLEPEVPAQPVTPAHHLTPETPAQPLEPLHPLEPEVSFERPLVAERPAERVDEPGQA